MRPLGAEASRADVTVTGPFSKYSREGEHTEIATSAHVQKERERASAEPSVISDHVCCAYVYLDMLMQEIVLCVAVLTSVPQSRAMSMLQMPMFAKIRAMDDNIKSIAANLGAD